MIATNIDGSAPNTNNALLDLLKVVADPAAYAAKAKELEDATANYQKLVALAGPASEIVAMRERIAADQKEAKADLAAAKAKAAGLIRDAEAKAEALLKDASVKAGAELAEASEKAKEVAATAKQVETTLADAEKAKADAARAVTDADERAATLDAEIAAAKQARMEAEELKADIVRKHQSFLASL